MIVWVQVPSPALKSSFSLMKSCFFIAVYYCNKQYCFRKTNKKIKKYLLILEKYSNIIVRIDSSICAIVKAEVAELADAHGSGPCGSNTLRVQVPSSA